MESQEGYTVDAGAPPQRWWFPCACGEPTADTRAKAFELATQLAKKGRPGVTVSHETVSVDAAGVTCRGVAGVWRFESEGQPERPAAGKKAKGEAK